MIVLDTSAVVAIILGEPEAEAFTTVLASGQAFWISALTVFECETVIRARKDQTLVSRVRELLALCRATVLAFDDNQAALATQAYLEFGKGVHPARLNLCDCAAYALAKSLNAPLLYKGDDFAMTDIARAVAPG